MFKIVNLLTGGGRYEQENPSALQNFILGDGLDRITGDETHLERFDIIRHNKAISTGGYPQNIINYNFLHGRTSLPRAEGYDRDIYPSSESDSSAMLANYLFAVKSLKPYISDGTCKIYRGTIVSALFFQELRPGLLLQTHQLSFFSESKIVAEYFIDSSCPQNVQVLFSVRLKEGGTSFREGYSDPYMYDKLRNEIRKQSNVSLTGVGSTIKEIILLPGELFRIEKISTKTHDITGAKIQKISLSYIESTANIYRRPLY